jgi:hypothetical protein
MVLGDKAAAKLGVGMGDKVTFVVPEVTVTPAGMFPRIKRFTVVGIFHVGAGEIDGHLVMTHVQDLARLQRWSVDQVQGIRLKFADLFEAPRTAWALAQTLGEGDYYARDWTRTHGNQPYQFKPQTRRLDMIVPIPASNQGANTGKGGTTSTSSANTQAKPPSANTARAGDNTAELRAKLAELQRQMESLNEQL